LRERFGPYLHNVWGMTETTAGGIAVPLGSAAPVHAASGTLSIGVPMQNVGVRVIAPDGTEQPPGEEGELEFWAPQVVSGYWQNPEADRSAFCGGYWKSGDIGSVDAEGYVRVLDRKKDLINRGGYKVYCIEVESVLARHPGVVEVAVIGRPDPVLGERVHAVVVARSAGIGEAELKRFCAENLSDYKVPDTIAFLPDALPRNANGKVQKTALRETLPPPRSPA